MGKTNFNMQLTDTEKEIMDFVTDVVFQEYNFSKADMVSVLFKNSAINYLGYDIQWHDISDEELLTLLKQHKREEDKKLIIFLGAEKYKSLIDDFKKNYPDQDPTYMEGLLKEFEAERGEKHE